MTTTCPRCAREVEPAGGRCPGCAHEFASLALYDPKHFVWLGMLFSFLVPAYLAGVNWGRCGRNDLKRCWLLGGTLSLATVFAGIAFLPSFGRLGGRVLGYAINFPLAYLLQMQQRPLFAAQRLAGASRASTVKGVWPGLGLVVLAVIPALALFELQPGPFDTGVKLLQEKHYVEAAAEFERALDLDPTNDAARFNAGLCYSLGGQWENSEKQFRASVQHQPGNAKAHAYLGYVLEHRGRVDEARRQYRAADSLEVGVTGRLFEPK